MFLGRSSIQGRWDGVAAIELLGQTALNPTALTQPTHAPPTRLRRPRAPPTAPPTGPPRRRPPPRARPATPPLAPSLPATPGPRPCAARPLTQVGGGAGEGGEHGISLHRHQCPEQHTAQHCHRIRPAPMPRSHAADRAAGVAREAKGSLKEGGNKAEAVAEAAASGGFMMWRVRWRAGWLGWGFGQGKGKGKGKGRGAAQRPRGWHATGGPRRLPGTHPALPAPPLPLPSRRPPRE